MTEVEIREFTDKIRQDLRAFRSRIADAETPSPSWNAFKPEVVAELVLKKREDVLSGLRLDLAKLRKSVEAKQADVRRDRYAELYPDTASGSPLRREDARYYDWRAHALLDVGVDAQLNELRGLLEAGEDGERSTRVYEWLKARPLTEAEIPKYSADRAVLLEQFEKRRGFPDYRLIERHFAFTFKELEEAGRFLALPPELQRPPKNVYENEKLQTALGR